MDGDLGSLLVGRYRLGAVLGQGGMGTVWRARDERLGREVAVKELRVPDGLDEGRRASWVARLDREARATARLKHPGIITVHDRVTSDDGRPLIIMELVHGPSLADVISSGGPLDPQEAARIGARILEALRVAHQAGITHRDIKPSNVLLEGDRVVLTDFGIAAMEGDVTLTGTGALLGTPAYMAPEQVRGQQATAESDLWSLGATLFTAVEGHPPFDGASTGAVLVAVATQEPGTAVHAGPLVHVINGLLRKNPAERLTADQLHALLTQLPPAGQPRGGAQPPPAAVPMLGPAALPAATVPLASPVQMPMPAGAPGYAAAAPYPQHPYPQHPYPQAGAIGFATGTWDKLSGGSSAKQELADKFHAPPGFGDPTRSQDGDGKVHLSFSYNGCSGECTAKNWTEAVDGTMASIQAIQGVRSVNLTAGSMRSCEASMGCPHKVEGLEFTTTFQIKKSPDGRPLLEISIG